MFFCFFFQNALPVFPLLIFIFLSDSFFYSLIHFFSFSKIFSFFKFFSAIIFLSHRHGWIIQIQEYIVSQQQANKQCPVEERPPWLQAILKSFFFVSLLFWRACFFCYGYSLFWLMSGPSWGRKQRHNYFTVMEKISDEIYSIYTCCKYQLRQK